MDMLFGVIVYFVLVVGFVVVLFLFGVCLDFMVYFFGDILVVG